MKPITRFEYDVFCATLSGPAGILVADGDYDKAVVWPNGVAINAVCDFCEAQKSEKLLAEKGEREAWSASLCLRADDFDEMARNDPDSAEYTRGMAEGYRTMADRYELWAMNTAEWDKRNREEKV
jgi:hypothetical protein